VSDFDGHIQQPKYMHSSVITIAQVPPEILLATFLISHTPLALFVYNSMDSWMFKSVIMFLIYKYFFLKPDPNMSSSGNSITDAAYIYMTVF
jgi:hypothetical protein